MSGKKPTDEIYEILDRMSIESSMELPVKNGQAQKKKQHIKPFAKPVSGEDIYISEEVNLDPTVTPAELRAEYKNLPLRKKQYNEDMAAKVVVAYTDGYPEEGEDQPVLPTGSQDSMEVDAAEEQMTAIEVRSLSLLTDDSDTRRDIRSAIHRYNLHRVAVPERVQVFKGLLKLMLGSDFEKVTREKLNCQRLEINYLEIMDKNLERTGSEYLEEPPYLRELREGGPSPWEPMVDWLMDVARSKEITKEMFRFYPMRDNAAARENKFKSLAIKLMLKYPDADENELQQRIWRVYTERAKAKEVNDL